MVWRRRGVADWEEVETGQKRRERSRKGAQHRQGQAGGGGLNGAPGNKGAGLGSSSEAFKTHHPQPAFPLS